MAANSSASRDDSPSSAFIRPHPLVFYAPPPPLVMVATPSGMYYTINPTYYYPPQPLPLPLYTYPRPAFPVDQSAATSADSDGNPQNFEVEDEVPMVSSQRSTETQRWGNVPSRKRRRPPTMNQRQAANPMEGGAAGSPTTLMINNIPYKLKRDFLLEFLDLCCEPESLEYDFFHLPLHYTRSSNLGYAFVNFTSNDAAKKMMKILDGYQWRGRYSLDVGVVSISSTKICKIKWASDDHQGKEAQLIRIFENSRFNICDHDEFSPVIFNPPRNGSHPNPTPPVALRRSRPTLPHPH